MEIGPLCTGPSTGSTSEGGVRRWGAPLRVAVRSWLVLLPLAACPSRQTDYPEVRLVLLFLALIAAAGTLWTAPAQSSQRALSKYQVQSLLADGVPSERVARLVRERGIDFHPTRADI